MQDAIPMPESGITGLPFDLGTRLLVPQLHALLQLLVIDISCQPAGAQIARAQYENAYYRGNPCLVHPVIPVLYVVSAEACVLHKLRLSIISAILLLPS